MSSTGNKKKNNKKKKAKKPASATAPATATTAAPKAEAKAEVKVTPKTDSAAPSSTVQPQSDPKIETKTTTTTETKQETKQTVPVPNVSSKVSDKEQAKLQAQLGNLQKQDSTLFVLGTKKETKASDLPKKETDLKKVPTAYFKNIEDGHYTIGANHRTNKILIEGCKNTTINIHGDVLTRTVEIWRCENCKFHFDTQVKTLQMDLCSKVSMHYTQKDHFGAIVWASTDDAKLTFGDAKDSNLETGFQQMLKEHPDSNRDIDQFIVRFLQDKLTTERCIRLKNGFLSTEREAIEWEKRNEIKRTQYVEDFLKRAGGHLKKAKDAQKKVGPNEECPCGSGKKHKKCCMGKTELSGVEGDAKKATI